MIRHVERFSVWVILGLFIAFGVFLTGPKAVLFFLMGTLLYTLPGWFACQLLWGRAFARSVEALGHTLVLGLLVTTGLVVALASMGLRFSVGLVLGTSLFLSVGLGLFQWLRKNRSSQVPLDSSAIGGTGRFILAAALVVALLVVAIPLSNVGRRVGDAYVYVSFFHEDFFGKVAMAAQLAKGVVPPANPYFLGETLHYYWFYDVFPAFVYQSVERTIPLQDILLLDALLVDVAFVCVGVWFIKRFVARPFSIGVVLCLVLLAESYQAPFKAVVFQRGISNVAANGLLASIAFPPVGYYFQALLYISQHLLALTALLLTISMLNGTHRTGMGWRAATAGVVLGIASGFSFFIGFIGLGWAASWLLLLALYWGRRGARMPRVVVPAAVAVVAGVVSYLGYKGLGMLAGEDRFMLLVKPDLRHLLSPIHYIVMLGPSLILGLVGCVLWAKRGRKPQVAGLLWLSILTFLLVQFVFLHHAWFEVSQKLGLVLRVPLLIYAGIGLDIVLSSLTSTKRRRVIVGVSLLCLSAVPNLLAYERAHFDITDSTVAMYVHASDRHAAEWIRDHTPLSAVVQSWPGQSSARPFFESGLESTYSLLAVFAERQMAIGDYEFARNYAVPIPQVEARIAEIVQLFEKPQASDTVDLIERYGIDYVYWGVSERECCLENLGWYEVSPLFEEVYDKDGVSIFRFKRE
jgi:hypothetical protein